MGINVNVKEGDNQNVVLTAQRDLERDLRSCMRCRFFYGNDSRCITKRCIKEPEQPDQTMMDTAHICYECPYKQYEGYCFPCMKKIQGSHG